MIGGNGVVVIIPNWNGWMDTVTCVDSVLRSTWKEISVVVVDNGSSDFSIEHIKEYVACHVGSDSLWIGASGPSRDVKLSVCSTDDLAECSHSECGFPDNPNVVNLIVLASSVNMGFAGANNLALAFARRMMNPAFVMLLNNDTVIDEECIQRLVETALEERLVAAIGPTILNFNHPVESECSQSSGGYINWLVYPGYHHYRRMLSTIGKSSLGVARECEWVSGAAMMLNMSLLSEVTLDDKYFFGCEDVELCFRLRKNGFRVVVNEGALVRHKGGASRARRPFSSLRKMLVDAKSNVKFARNSTPLFPVILPLYVLQVSMIVALTVIGSAMHQRSSLEITYRLNPPFE